MACGNSWNHSNLFEGRRAWIVIECLYEYHVFFRELSKICKNGKLIFKSKENKEIKRVLAESIIEISYSINRLEFFKDHKLLTDLQIKGCTDYGEILRFQKTEIK